MGVTARKFGAALGRIVLGLYKILAAYLAGWVLALAVVALGLNLATEAIVGQFGYPQARAWWQTVEVSTGVDAAYLRLSIYTAILVAVFLLLRGPFGLVQELFDKKLDLAVSAYRFVTDGRPVLAVIVRTVATVVVTLILVPFLIQPTLVGTGTGAHDWVDRGANLVDGTASRHIIDSVVGIYRRPFTDDVETDRPVADVEPEDEIADDQWGDPDSMMGRWDPTIADVSDDEAQMFAFVKAFMQIESAGRQFAVSHTGCAGLMQFCAGTAQRRPFSRIFGTGSVYPCGCTPSCETPDDVARALESGDRDQIPDLNDRFPCSLSDSRFDATKSLRAGARYIQQLRDSYRDNLYLMYIGYNSGPAVADELWRRLDRDPDAGLDEIEDHLADALRPHFGEDAPVRANSLAGTHLPRLRDAYDDHFETARVAGLGEQTSRLVWAPRCGEGRRSM